MQLRLDPMVSQDNKTHPFNYHICSIDRILVDRLYNIMTSSLLTITLTNNPLS